MNKYIKFAVLALLAVGAFYWLNAEKEKPIEYTTKPVEKGNITEKITASGIINPISTVNIGTQVSGTIAKIFVDYNSEVKKNQLLAQIDPALFEATVNQKRAALNIAKAEVDVVKNDIEYYRKHLNRIKKLNSSKYSTDSELESAVRDYNNAVVQFELKKAQVTQAEAALQSAETELRYTKIISPVDGIVVSKEVEVGQTVAASFQTPTLFNVAEDLTKMQIEASIVEADIAKVKEGQLVEFTVDSFPDETFYGMVMQVRNNPITVSNVVTYEVIIDVNNQEAKLKPGMTANVEVITAQKEDVLLVPNQALRFYMNDGSGPQKRYSDKGLWILKNGVAKRVTIKTGVSDEDKTEVSGKELQAGDEVIVERVAGGTPHARSVRMRMPR